MLARRRRTRQEMARNLMTLARAYFVEKNNGVDLIQLVDIIDQKLEDPK